MSLETTAANQRAIERLAPAPGEAVLEVGCGHGRTLAKVASSGVRLDGSRTRGEVLDRVGLCTQVTGARRRAGAAAHSTVINFRDLSA